MARRGFVDRSERQGFTRSTPVASCGESSHGPSSHPWPAEASWTTRAVPTKKPPAEAGGLRVACLPRCHALWVRTGYHVPSSGMDGGMVFTPGVPGLPPGASWTTRAVPTKSPRRKPGDSGSHAFPGAMRCGFAPGITCRHPAWTAVWFSHPVSPGFHPGLLGPRAPCPQKAPGGSRGTPGSIASRVPCAVGSHRGITCRHPAWTA
jgi:hypothetical protein